METYIYIDVLFALNFCMDFIIIGAAGKLCGRKAKNRRVLCGAAFASLLYVIFYMLGAKGAAGTLLGALGILGGLAIAFLPLGARSFAKLALGAYALTIALGGGCLAAYYTLSANGAGKETVPLWLLAASSAAAYIAVSQTVKHFKRRADAQVNYVTARVRIQGAEAAFTALVDTGNTLREPISGRPVIVAEFAALKELFPDEIRRLFRDETDVDLEHAACAFTGAGYADRLRLVPYRSVGERGGLLVGFRPDDAYIGDKSGLRRDVIVAVYNGALSAEGDYSGLVGPELLTDKSNQ